MKPDSPDEADIPTGGSAASAASAAGAASAASAAKTLHDLRNAVGTLHGSFQIALDGSAERRGAHRKRVDQKIRKMAMLIAQLEQYFSDCAAPQPTQPLLRSSPPPTRVTIEPVPTASSHRLPRRTVPKVRGSKDASPIVPVAGTLVDSYRIEAELGRGGMGTVVRANDVLLKRSVAIKFLNVDAWGAVDAHALFLREARVMAQVRHPNVVSIYALGQYEQRPYFVMELVEGQTLADFLANHGGLLPIDDSLAILDQICSGVEAIHDHGACHRDLKPNNILLGEMLRVAVADFGLSGKVGGAQQLHAGTPGFMAPEMATGENSGDIQTDIYALGAIGFELLLNQAAFAGADQSEILLAQHHGRLSVPKTTKPRDALVQVMVRALSRNPLGRHQTVDEFRDEIRRVRELQEVDYKGRQVLVVDDDLDNLEHLTAVVQNEVPGAAIKALSGGIDAIEWARNQVRVDLALVDLEMPGVNGVELTALLKTLQPAPQVVVVTGVGGARDWSLLRKMGASAFVLKPIDPTAIGALVRKCLRTDVDSGHGWAAQISSAHDGPI